MPLTKVKKSPKLFPRQSSKQRSAPPQTSPASHGIVSDSDDETAHPQPESSNVISACTDTLQVQEQMEGVEGWTSHITGGHPIMENMARDSTKSGPLSSFCPPPLSNKAGAPKRASLMGLPVELRIMIFKRVYPSSESRGTTETILYCAPTLRVLGPYHSPLYRVNRQIYEETKDLLHRETLVFLSREALTNFSAMRTPQQMSQLRSICMKPRVTDWVGAVKTLNLPPGASLMVHWPITRKLWEALIANVTLDYRKVTLIPGHKEQLVVFEPYPDRNTRTVSYEYLQWTFEK